MVLATLLLENKLGATPLQAGQALIAFGVLVILGSRLPCVEHRSTTGHRHRSGRCAAHGDHYPPRSLQGSALGWAAAAVIALSTAYG